MGLAGLWCVNVGYSSKAIVRAVTEQLERLPYYPSFFNSTTEPADPRGEIPRGKGAARVNRTIFSNSGSEANETALKVIRAYWKLKGRQEKKKVLSRTFSYHGVTLATASHDRLAKLSATVRSSAGRFSSCAEPLTPMAPRRS